MSINFDF